MAINFPTTPANNTIYPNVPVTPGIAYRYRTAEPAWRDMRGTALRQNRFLNPSHQISQINGFTDATNVGGLYMGDEWYVFYGSNVGVYRGQRLELMTPRGGPFRIRITINTADTSLASTDRLQFNTGQEGINMADVGYGTAAAKQMVARFGWKSPAGTYTFAIKNFAGTHSFLAPFTVTAGQANTDLEFTIIIPPCTIGTWDTANGSWAYFYWTIAHGTKSGTNNTWFAGNFSAANSNSNGWTPVGAAYELFDCGLYVDPNLTGIAPEFEVPDLHDEFQRMQRYCARIYGLRGIVTAGTIAERMGTTLPVPMRVVPALSVRGAPHVWDSVAVPTISSVSANYSSKNFIDCQLTTSGGLTAGNACCQYMETSLDYIRADAELP